MGQSNCCLYNIRRYRSDGTTFWHRDYAGHKGAICLDTTYENTDYVNEIQLNSSHSNSTRLFGNPRCIDSNDNYVAVGGEWVSGAFGDPEWYNIAVYNYDGSLRWRRGIETSQTPSTPSITDPLNNLHYGKYNIISICIDVNNNIWACGTRTRGGGGGIIGQPGGGSSTYLDYRLWKFDINGNQLNVFNIYAQIIKRRSAGGIWFTGALPLGDLTYFGLPISAIDSTTGSFYFDSNDIINGIYYNEELYSTTLYGTLSFSFAYTNYPIEQFYSGSILSFCESDSTHLTHVGPTITLPFMQITHTLPFPCVAKAHIKNHNGSVNSSNALSWAISPKDHWYGYNTNLILNPGDNPSSVPEYNDNDYTLNQLQRLHSINSIDNSSSCGMWICGRYWDESRNTMRLAKIDDSNGDIISEFNMNDEFNEDGYPNYPYPTNILCLTDSHLILKSSSSFKKGNNFSKFNTSAEVEYRHKHLVYSSFVGHSSTLDGGHVAASSTAYRIGAAELSFIE